MKKHSLSTRITLLLGISTVLIIGAAAVVMDSMVDTEMMRRFDDSLLSQASTLTTLATLGSARTVVEDANQATQGLLDGETTAAYAIQCASGHQIHSNPAVPLYPPNWMTDRASESEFTDINANGETWRTLQLRFNAWPERPHDASTLAPISTSPDPCRLLLMQPRTEVDEILTTVDNILLLTPLAALLAVLLLSPMLVRRGLKPLATLAEEMRHIGPHASGQRLHDSNTRELEPLVGRFNEVLTRMDAGVLREREFAGALAHETRTRLAELRVLVDVERRYPGGRPLEDLLGDVGSIGAELESIVSGLLWLTRLDAGIESPQLGRVNLGEHLSRQLEHIANTLQQRQLRIDLQPTSNHHLLTADPALLDIVLGNLLANAGNYAPSGGTIQIHYDPHTLTIRNLAPDLDADDVARFGQRYWSKHHGTGGHFGLGLTLAGAAATAMQLRLTFSLDGQQQLQASLQWPDDLEVLADQHVRE
ncbi:MAG: sensor histidine kinase [Rhodanobacter sp.]